MKKAGFGAGLQKLIPEPGYGNLDLFKTESVASFRCPRGPMGHKTLHAGPLTTWRGIISKRGKSRTKEKRKTWGDPRQFGARTHHPKDQV